MQNIQLDELQKVKLMEMIIILFPELVPAKESFEILDIRGGDDDSWHIMHYDGEKWDIVIHWFEFCFAELAPILALKAAKTDLLMEEEFMQFQTIFYYEILLHRVTHPVDYLYEEFKKLK